MSSARLASLVLAAAWPVLAQSPSTVSLSAAASTIICGNQLQVSALASDNSGHPVNGASFTWSSSDNTIASVDSSGNVTAILPGLVSITAAAGGARGTIQLQTMPLGIVVTPANKQMHIGDQVQYSAAVLDINQQPLSTAVTWQLAGANGRVTSEASLTNSGLLTAYAASNLTIRAVIVYPNAPSDFVAQFVGESSAVILPPPDYNLRRLLTTDDTRQSFRLLARRGGIAVNDSEQLVTVAALDGLSDGVLSSDQSGYQILASGGTATLNPGGNLIDFRDPVINNQGNVLVRADAMGNAGSLLLLSKTQFQFLLTDGTTSGYTDLENSNVSHFSLNDNGAVVLQATYLPLGSSTRATGLFDIQRGNVNLDVSSPGTTLPGLSAAFTFDQDYGMDGQGNVYFGAFDANSHGIFRAARDGTITKVVAVGDQVGGAPIRTIFRLGIDLAGDLAIGCDHPDGTQVLLLYPGGNLTAAPNLLPINAFQQIWAVNAAGVLFQADGGQGWGLYLWAPNSNTASLVLLPGRPGPAGDLILEIQGAAMTSAGIVFAKVRTAAQPLEMLRIASGVATLLFQSGDRISIPANLTLRGLVPGAAAGDSNPLMGGFQSSIFQITDAAGLVPRVLLGDRLSTAPYYGTVAAKSPPGILYVAADDGIFRVDSSGNNLLVGLPRADSDGVTEFTPNTVTANDSGTLAWISSTSQNHSRLSLWSGGQVQLLAYIGANPQYRTASPSGGYFANWQEIAIDRGGRVMARLTVNGGPSGYFLWSNGQWTPAALFGQTKVGGQVVDGANQVQASGTNFYAILTERGIPSVLAQFDGTNWNPQFAVGQSLPDGAALNWFLNLSVNHAGEIAFSGFADGGYPEIVVLAGNTPRLALTAAQPLPDGNFIFSVPQIDFRDDHRLFFVAFDLLDRVNLYVAQPNF